MSNAETAAAKPQPSCEIVITRIFDAPRERVWQAWTDPAQIVQWWGPNGFTNTLQEMDVRAGGIWRHIMHGPDGTNYPNKVVYAEVVPPTRLVYTHADDTEKHACQFRVTVVFEDAGEGKTKMIFTMLFETPELRDATANAGAIEGGEQTMSRLAAYLGMPQ